MKIMMVHGGMIMAIESVLVVWKIYELEVIFGVLFLETKML
tara:strand:- start:78 stop:200 length:123 start_codon:yes stop_codon:yes gene_type:complete